MSNSPMLRGRLSVIALLLSIGCASPLVLSTPHHGDGPDVNPARPAGGEATKAELDNGVGRVRQVILEGDIIELRLPIARGRLAPMPPDLSELAFNLSVLSS